MILQNGCVLRLAAARRLPASRRRHRSPGPQVNGASLHCNSDVVRVPADVGVLWIMATARGKVIPPAENGFITFRRLSTPFARGPPTRTRLNGDDRMPDDHEQLRLTPNSPRRLLRQATSEFATLLNGRITSNSTRIPRPSVTTRRVSPSGPPIVSGTREGAAINPRDACYPRSIWLGNSADTAYYNAEKTCPAPERGAREGAMRGLPGGYKPAWARSWSALSVRSQVKPSPVRPKWP